MSHAPKPGSNNDIPGSTQDPSPARKAIEKLTGGTSGAAGNVKAARGIRGKTDATLDAAAKGSGPASASIDAATKKVPSTKGKDGQNTALGAATGIAGAAAKGAAGETKASKLVGGGVQGAAVGGVMEGLRKENRKKVLLYAALPYAVIMMAPVLILGAILSAIISMKSGEAGGSGVKQPAAQRAALDSQVPKDTYTMASQQGQRSKLPWEIIAATYMHQRNGADGVGDGTDPVADQCISGPARLPLVGRFRVSSNYGMRFHPVLHRNRLHAGVDMAQSPGPDLLVAAMAGTVTARKIDSNGTLIVSLGVGENTQLNYLHLSKFQDGLKVGDKVWPGRPLGVEGSTGLSSGNHLHFEVMVDGKHVEPRAWMAKHGVKIPQLGGWGTGAAAVMSPPAASPSPAPSGSPSSPGGGCPPSGQPSQSPSSTATPASGSGGAVAAPASFRRPPSPTGSVSASPRSPSPSGSSASSPSSSSSSSVPPTDGEAPAPRTCGIEGGAPDDDEGPDESASPSPSPSGSASRSPSPTGSMSAPPEPPESPTPTGTSSQAGHPAGMSFRVPRLPPTPTPTPSSTASPTPSTSASPSPSPGQDEECEYITEWQIPTKGMSKDEQKRIIGSESAAADWIGDHLSKIMRSDPKLRPYMDMDAGLQPNMQARTLVMSTNPVLKSRAGKVRTAWETGIARLGLGGLTQDGAKQVYETAFQWHTGNKSSVTTVTDDGTMTCPVPGEDFTVESNGRLVMTKALRERAAIIVATGKAGGITKKGQILALMVVMQEGGFKIYRNNTVPESAQYENDAVVPAGVQQYQTVGMYMQRKGYGWGTVAQMMDPASSSKAFYGLLPGQTAPGLTKKVPDYDSWPEDRLGELADKVQVAATPAAYMTKLAGAKTIWNAVSGAQCTSTGGSGVGMPPGEWGKYQIPGGGCTECVKAALSTIGTQYSFGGGGPQGPSTGVCNRYDPKGCRTVGFDCSGMTSYGYFKGKGTTLPRTAAKQYYATLANGTFTKSTTDLKPGDLMFFYPSGSGVRHVGMYIGNGMGVHAARPGTTVMVETVAKMVSYMPYVGGGRL